MSLIRHTFIALAYSVIAAATAMAAPKLFPAVGQELGVVIGAVVLIGCALLHEVSARQDDRAALADEVHDLRLSYGEVMQELTQARQEVGLIREALAKGGVRGSSKALEQDVHDVVAEVRMLQSLVEQLSRNTAVGQTAQALPALRPMPVRAAAGGDVVDVRDLAPVARDLDDGSILGLIQDGLKRDRVDLVFQPIVSLPQRKRRYYEAFSRIRAADGSVIVPEQYIAIAEREGLITAIDNMLLFRCVQLLRKAQQKNRNVGFFCNISPYTLADRQFFSEFVEFMAENQELAINLVFEFAQSTIANRDDDIERQLERLSAMGFRFSLDQVASLKLDYAGLATRHFKFVKIDAGSLLSQTERAEIDLRDFKRALDSYGIDLIVEKIESEETLLELLDFNIDFGQGYLFGEPRTGKSG